MHQCEVTPASENPEGSSLHLENKGAGEDVSATSQVVTAAVSTNPGTICFFFSPSHNRKLILSVPVFAVKRVFSELWKCAVFSRATLC